MLNNQKNGPVFTPVWFRADWSALVQIIFGWQHRSRHIFTVNHEPPVLMLGLAQQASMPLSNFMFSGRISLTIICKNQSVSINFEIAAVKKWQMCVVPFVFTSAADHRGAVKTRRSRRIDQGYRSRLPLFDFSCLNPEVMNLQRF